jgi:hypothetical protein
VVRHAPLKELLRSDGEHRAHAERHASSRSDALSQIDDRKVYGAFEPATNRRFVASAIP